MLKLKIFLVGAIIVLVLVGLYGPTTMAGRVLVIAGIGLIVIAIAKRKAIMRYWVAQAQASTPSGTTQPSPPARPTPAAPTTPAQAKQAGTFAWKKWGKRLGYVAIACVAIALGLWIWSGLEELRDLTPAKLFGRTNTGTTTTSLNSPASSEKQYITIDDKTWTPLPKVNGTIHFEPEIATVEMWVGCFDILPDNTRQLKAPPIRFGGEAGLQVAFPSCAEYQLMAINTERAKVGHWTEQKQK